MRCEAGARLAMSPAAWKSYTDGQDRLAEKIRKAKKVPDGEAGEAKAARLRVTGERGLAALRRGEWEDVTGEMVSAFGALAVCGLRGCHRPGLRLVHGRSLCFEASSFLGCRVRIVTSSSCKIWTDGGFGRETGHSQLSDPLPIRKGQDVRREKMQQIQGNSRFSRLNCEDCFEPGIALRSSQAVENRFGFPVSASCRWGSKKAVQ